MVWIDPYQVAHIKSLEPKISKKEIKRYNAYLTMMVGFVVSIASIYIADVVLNITQKKKFKDIFKVTSNYAVYMAAVISGGINGILVVYLKPCVYPLAAVLVVTTVYEGLASLFNLQRLTNFEIVQFIIRDLFLIYLILTIIDLLLGRNLIIEDSGGADIDDNEIKDFESLIGVTLISAIVINISLVTSRLGINKLFNITSTRTDLTAPF